MSWCQGVETGRVAIVGHPGAGLFLLQIPTSSELNTLTRDLLTSSDRELTALQEHPPPLEAYIPVLHLMC